jgi:hypothetical protein
MSQSIIVQKRKRVAEGDLVAVPLADSRFAFCKILFLSSYYRDVILLGASRVAFDHLDSLPPIPDRFDAKRFYTGRKSFRVGRWHRLAAAPLAPDERESSLRIVAGGVWLRDEMLREATAQDLRELPTMSVAGAGLAEIWLSRLLVPGFTK